MKYMLLCYNDPAILAAMTEQEQGTHFQDYMIFNQEIQAQGVAVSQDMLHPVTTATTVRVRDGETLTIDGPFAETKEQLGGYYILDCENLDEAIELAAKIPAAQHSSVEIRPIMVLG